MEERKRYNGAVNPFTNNPTIKLDSSVIIKAYKISIRMIELSWTELDHEKWFPTGEEIAILEKSDSPTGEFFEIAKIKRNSPPCFIDEHTLTTEYRTEVCYYRIRTKEYTTNTFSSEKIHNFYGAEIVRRHGIQLKEGHSGNPMYLFIKKRNGDRCPECWDSIRGVRTKSNCKTCMGTGYLTGFHDPICIYVSLAPEQTAIQQPPLGAEIEGKLQGWTLAYPRINLGDVLVDPGTQDIWEVAAVSITTHKRTPTKQDIIVDRHAEDTSIMQLLSMIPRELKREDLRHGELIF